MPPSNRTPDLRATIRRQLDSIYAGPAWHGPSVRASLRGLGVEEARWSPGDGRNSVWELLLHLAYAKHRVALRVDPAIGRFERRLAKSWWPALPDVADARALAADLRLLADSHARLVAVLDGASDARLATRRGSRFTLGDQLLGAAHHDAYHAGQIRLVRRMWESRHR